MNKLKLPTNFETIAINEQTNYRLNEINKIKDYFECEIKKQQTIKKLSKYITGFDYTDKVLTVFLTVFSAVSIFSHIKTKKHTGLVSTVLILFFSLSTAIIKNTISNKKEEKKYIIKYFIWLKLN